jgi:TPR repeat protein
MYDNGEGVPQDNVYAHMWFNIASSNGSESARANRDIAAKRMTPNQLAEGQSLARECVKKDYKNC